MLSSSDSTDSEVERIKIQKKEKTKKSNKEFLRSKFGDDLNTLKEEIRRSINDYRISFGGEKNEMPMPMNL